MKVPPKRTGNANIGSPRVVRASALNESPSEKEGKFCHCLAFYSEEVALNESPSEKEGKSRTYGLPSRPSPALNESPSEKEGKYSMPTLKRSSVAPSMKVPPKRKGNLLPLPLSLNPCRPQ